VATQPLKHIISNHPKQLLLLLAAAFGPSSESAVFTSTHDVAAAEEGALASIP
jgi:hypothetical protein